MSKHVYCHVLEVHRVCLKPSLDKKNDLICTMFNIDQFSSQCLLILLAIPCPVFPHTIQNKIFNTLVSSLSCFSIICKGMLSDL